MTDDRSERRLREWFASSPAIDEPAGLHDFLAALPAAHPHPAQRSASAARRRLTLVAASLAAVVTVTALATVGARLLETSPGPSAPTTSVQRPATPSASPSSIGAAVRIGEHAGTSASLAETAGGAVALVAGVRVDATSGTVSGPGGACPPSAIGTVGPGSIDWSAAPGAILQIAGGPASVSPLGLGVSADCATSRVAVPDGSGGFSMIVAPNPMRPDAEFLAVDPLDPTSAVSWVTDRQKFKGGFASWTNDGGRTWQSETAARPVGWDGSGAFWVLADDGELARSQGPGFGSARSGIIFDVLPPQQGLAVDLSAVAIFRDRVLVAPADGGLQTASTSAGSSAAQAVVGLDGHVVGLSAGSRFVAGLADDGTGNLVLAISADGRTFRPIPLPSAFARSAGSAAPRVLALDDRVILSDAGPAGIIGVWSVPIGGLPSPPPPPTPEPTATLPSAPPPRVTSTWTAVSPPTITGGTGGGTTSGGGGGVAALPTGGFIDFVVESAQRTVIFRSADGSSWTRSGEVTGQDASEIAAMVAFDGHRYVALGRQGGGQFYGGQSNGAAWVSTDLAHWTKAPVQQSFGGAEFSGIAAGPDGFVAIGFDNGGQAVWTSADGLTWRALTGDAALPRDSTFPSAILYRAGGFVMVGRIDQESAVWTSADGRRWSRTKPAGSGEGFSVLADGDAGLLSFGAGGPLVEIAPGDFRGPIVPWLSSDGVSWKAGVASPALFGASPGVVAAPGGYVAAGTAGLDPVARLWTSTDGVDWVEVAGVDFAGSSSVGLASDGRHVLAVGLGGDGGAVMLVSGGIDR